VQSLWESTFRKNISPPTLTNSVALDRKRTIPPERPRLSTKLLPTSADRRCCVVSATDPYIRILDFLDRVTCNFRAENPKSKKLACSRCWIEFFILKTKVMLLRNLDSHTTQCYISEDSHIYEAARCISVLVYCPVTLHLLAVCDFN
jgi:hypothetical protein